MIDGWMGREVLVGLVFVVGMRNTKSIVVIPLNPKMLRKSATKNICVTPRVPPTRYPFSMHMVPLPSSSIASIVVSLVIHSQ